MLNADYHLSIFQLIKLLKSHEFKSLFVLILNFCPFQYFLIVKLIAESYLGRVFVFAVKLYMHSKYLSGAFIAMVNGRLWISAS